ncbi:transposon DIRS-1, partial [Cavenderia fasciculata]
KGYASKTITVMRSCIAQIAKIRDNRSVSDDFMVQRVMSGIAHQRPSKPKYNNMWCPLLVFDHIRDQHADSTQLSTKQLLAKSVVLIKLFCLARASDLGKWSFRSLDQSITNCIRGTIVNAKEQRNSDSPSALVVKGIMKPSICPLATLREYLSRTKAKRSKKSKDAVFIDSSGLPLVDKDFSSITLSFLDKAGVDTNVYKAHSTRAAMASWLLLNGISLHRVKKLGRWRSNAALEKYYDMEIIDQDSKRSKDFVSN